MHHDQTGVPQIYNSVLTCILGNRARSSFREVDVRCVPSEVESTVLLIVQPKIKDAMNAIRARLKNPRKIKLVIMFGSEISSALRVYGAQKRTIKTTPAAA